MSVMTIEEYDIKNSALVKAWKTEFQDYLRDYYKPSFVDAEKVYKAIANVNSYMKKQQYGGNLLLVKDISEVDNLRSSLLSHRSYAMGKTVSANDYRVIVIERYIGFLKKQSTATPIVIPAATIPEVEIQAATEGFLKEITYFRKKRNRAIRNQCAEKYNYTCQVCGFNFEKTYGARGRNYIEVHHLKPMANYDDEHNVNIEDLIALCSNCHSMIHNGPQLLTPDELKELMK